ncbi:MAG: FliI/YscN family ATPase [Nitrospirae bacterium]|nr:FliI/YscN family ATPase [Nitrospirota bacterium]
MIFSAEKYIEGIEKADLFPVKGKVTQAIGLVLEGRASISAIGEVCEITSLKGKRVLAEVVGFKEEKVLLMPLGDLSGIGPGSSIEPKGTQAMAGVGPGLLGRVIDGLGNPIDHKGPVPVSETFPLYDAPPGPLERKRITQPLDLGIRAINGLLTCGRGQRLGIFAGSGVGKSVLLGMIARFTEADVNVIALIGERGREVKEFIEKDLKEEGLKRSVVVAATSDQSPLIRRRGAFLAMAIAEYFRSRQKEVLLMMDSLTRLAHAQREIGLATGEPPATKGYTPSVFSLLPKFLERSGTSSHEGSITGLFTVLAEGDDLNDPIPDAARSILDGHLVLSRELASKNQYPAIDPLRSTSRVMLDIAEPAHLESSRKFLQLLSLYERSEDLINLGAYKRGTNPQIDKAIDKQGELQSYLAQDMHEKVNFKESREALFRIIPPLSEKPGR